MMKTIIRCSSIKQSLIDLELGPNYIFPENILGMFRIYRPVK